MGHNGGWLKIDFGVQFIDLHNKNTTSVGVSHKIADESAKIKTPYLRHYIYQVGLIMNQYC